MQAHLALLFATSCCALAGQDDPAPAAPRLVHVANWKRPTAGSVEILDVQAKSGRVVVTCDASHAVTVLDLSDPRAPRHLADHPLPQPAGELTSVAFHPELDVVLAVVEDPEPGAPGMLFAFDAKSGALLASVATGIEPDAVAIDPSGRFAAVANEAESFWLDPETETYCSGRGSVSFVDLSGLPDTLAVRTIELIDIAPFLAEASTHDRFLERSVGRSAHVVAAGGWPGCPIAECEPKAEGVVLVPLVGTHAELLEPEAVAFSPDGARLFVTLQENNLIAVFDVEEARLRAVWDLGITHHAADLHADDALEFSEALHALREPDGLAVTPDGRYVVTADEGDSESSRTRPRADAPVGGGRTLSVFDAATGALVGDTGDQLDRAAAAAGVYPDARSAKKGCEPEGVVTFLFEGQPYAAVALERASAVALVSLADPSAPRVSSVTPLPAGSVAPEGIEVLVRGDELFVLTANEVSGDVSVFALLR